jgi:hypothetical protein
VVQDFNLRENILDLRRGALLSANSSWDYASIIVITVDETDLGVANSVFTKSFVSRVLNKDLVIQSTVTKNARTVSGARGGFR